MRHFLYDYSRVEGCAILDFQRNRKVLDELRLPMMKSLRQVPMVAGPFERCREWSRWWWVGGEADDEDGDWRWWSCVFDAYFIAVTEIVCFIKRKKKARTKCWILVLWVCCPESSTQQKALASKFSFWKQNKKPKKTFWKPNQITVPINNYCVFFLLFYWLTVVK